MPSSPFQRITFSTSHLEPRLRTYALAQWVKPFAEIHPDGDAPMAASFIAYDLGGLMLVRSTSSPAGYIRRQESIAHGPFKDFVLLRLVVKGAVRGCFSGGESIDLGEGDIYLSDLAKPAELWTGESEHLNLLIPRRTSDKMHSLHGCVLRDGWLPNRMLAQHLLHLEQTIPDLDAIHAQDVIRRTVDVVLTCLGAGNRTRGGRERNDILHERIQEHIDDQLDNSELDIAAIQRRFRVSRTCLYRLFAEVGGIQQYIRARRLDAAVRDLRDEPARNISEIAFSHGFTNERQFQRAMRARYGMSARDVRFRQRS